MKKKTCIVLLAALTWLNAYQIGDAAEDAAETIQTSIQTVVVHHPFISSPALPDDDDADLPLVVSQALVHGPFSFYGSQQWFYILLKVGHPLSQSLALEHLHNLSPPHSLRDRFFEGLAPAHVTFAPSARSLAPPLSAH